MNYNSYITAREAKLQKHIEDAQAENDEIEIQDLEKVLERLKSKVTKSAIIWAQWNLGDKTFEEVWHLAEQKRDFLYNRNSLKQSRKFYFWDAIYKFCQHNDDEHLADRYSRKFSSLFEEA